MDAADAGVSRRLELPCRRGRRCLRPWPHPFRSLHHWHGRPATSNRGCSGWTGRFLDCPELGSLSSCGGDSPSWQPSNTMDAESPCRELQFVPTTRQTDPRQGQREGVFLRRARTMTDRNDLRVRTETMYPAQIGPPPLAGRDAASVSKGRSGTRTIRQAAAVYHRAASGHLQSLEHAEFGSSRVRTSTMRPPTAVTSTTAAAACMKSIRLPLENPSHACHVGVTLCDKT